MKALYGFNLTSSPCLLCGVLPGEQHVDPSSPTPLPSTETVPNTPNASLNTALKSEKFVLELDELLSHTGTQLLESWRTVQMVRATLISGRAATPDTHIRKHKVGSSEAFNSVPPPAPSSRKSTRKAVKGALSSDRSLPQFNSLTELMRYGSWIMRAKRTDCEDNRTYWMNKWGSKGFKDSPSCPETSAGTGAPSPS